jgi:hypothetical protein
LGKLAGTARAFAVIATGEYDEDHDGTDHAADSGTGRGEVEDRHAGRGGRHHGRNAEPDKRDLAFAEAGGRRTISHGELLVRPGNPAIGPASYGREIVAAVMSSTKTLLGARCVWPRDSETRFREIGEIAAKMGRFVPDAQPPEGLLLGKDSR